MLFFRNAFKPVTWDYKLTSEAFSFGNELLVTEASEPDFVTLRSLSEQPAFIRDIIKIARVTEQDKIEQLQEDWRFFIIKKMWITKVKNTGL